MSEQLKPCPFCGETPDVNNPATFQTTQSGAKWGAVICCCTGPEVRTGYGPVEHWMDAAIAAWNKRDGDERLAAIQAAAEPVRKWLPWQSYPHIQALLDAIDKPDQRGPRP